MKTALFVLVLPLRVINGVKRPYKNNYSPENETCVQTSFSAIFVLNKIMALIFQIIYI